MKLEEKIGKSIDEVCAFFVDKEPPIFTSFYYGAVDINPAYLTIWYIFKLDKELRIAENIGFTSELIELTKKYLKKYKYPEKAMNDIIISFTSDEDIQKTTGGNYWYYFK
jgi:hypothetical protein